MAVFGSEPALLPFPSIHKILPPIFSNSRITISISARLPNQNLSTWRRRVVVSAEGNNGISNDSVDGFNGEDLKKDQRPILSFSWRDLLNPDPENILAVGLTGLLTWASVQVLWQLFVISLAIVLSALKYSFIAALLLIILITLL
ncbi:hypothetical protein ACHQM5_010198 [Ranunculus cassubicifolius]